MTLRRRDLFGLGGLGGVIGLLGGLAWPRAKRIATTRSDAAPLPLLDVDCTSDSSGAGTGLGYSAKFGPPAYLAAGSRDALHTPPPWAPRTTEVR